MLIYSWWLLQAILIKGGKNSYLNNIPGRDSETRLLNSDAPLAVNPGWQVLREGTFLYMSGLYFWDSREIGTIVFASF